MRLPRCLRLAGFVFLFAVPALLRAEVPMGRILEKVACASDNAQTYALYVPTSFNRTRAWPVLFCFDPAARGKTPVERFRAAAEKFGWIVAGSNNSRNGPWEANVAAIQAMLRDVEQNLPIDHRRIYVAGLSGGARVACQVAVGGVAQGVIACSAGFMGSEPPGKVAFPVFGTAGENDFNFRELRRLDRELDSRQAAHRIVIFRGGHEWLPADLTFEALAWLELQAMRAGSAPRNEAWIAEQFAARQAAVPREPVAENYRALKSLAADFKGLADTAALETQVKTLAAARTVREALKAELVLETTEQTLNDRLMEAAMDRAIAAERKLIGDLQTKARSAPTPAERAMAQRVLQGVASGCGEMAREALRADEYDSAAVLLEAVVLLRPERAQGHFDLARAYAFLGDRKRALAALRQAVAAGFKDRARIDDEKAFAKWRGDPELAALVAGLAP